jgi:hypothetical protein
MTRFGWQVVLGAVVVLAIVISAVEWMQSREQAEPFEQAKDSAPVADPSQLSIYTSGEYGFSFFYPSAATIMDAYTASSTLGGPWRMHAVATGTPIVQVTNGTEEMHVGLSTDAKELAACLKPSPGEESRGTFAVGSSTWQEFMFEKLGTDKEASVTSYRILHDKACYAVEVYTPLNGSAPDAQYSVQDMITSFTFAD